MNLMVTQDDDLDRYGPLGSIIPYVLFGVDLYCLVFEIWTCRGWGRRGWLVRCAIDGFYGYPHDSFIESGVLGYK